MGQYDVAVIGGGPAGLAATVYASQAQLRTALVAPQLGGKVSHSFQLRGLPAVETVWGNELVRQFEAYVEAKLKAFFPRTVTEISQHKNGSFQLKLADTSLILARSLIVCTGAQPQRLYVHGEKDFYGRGVSFSAVSHAQFFRNRDVAVVGGERALPAALKLAAVANHVYYILAHKQEIHNPQLNAVVQRNRKISLFYDWEVQSIVGDDFVTGINLVATNAETRTLPVEGVFVEFGLLPNSQLMRGLVDLDKDGHIIVNHRCETSMPGIFAAGDVTNVYAEQVPVAIGEGVKAALSAWSYLAVCPEFRMP
jgi:thioredoxin reductase